MSHASPVGEGRLRRAAGADLAPLLALERRCFSVDAQSRRSMAHLLTRANGEAWLIEDGSQPMAYVVLLYRRGSRVARIYSIAVDPAARGRGLGRRLIAWAMVRAEAAGCRRASAEARASNTASRALFAACGFVEAERLPGYYPADGGALEEGVRLVRSLLSPMAPTSP